MPRIRQPDPSPDLGIGRFACVMLACVAAGIACLAHAGSESQPTGRVWLDGVGATVGTSDGEWMARVTLVSDWTRGWDFGGGRLTGYWDGSLGYWDVEQKPGRANGVLDVGFTPMLRFTPSLGGEITTYFEAGIGIHLLSHTVDAESHQVSTAFQFGDQAGIGVRFGEGGRYEVGYRYLHLSNGGIKDPNGGVDFHLLRLNYRLN